MNQIYFSSTVKKLRKQRSLTQEQAANALGVSVQAVSKWECAQSYPDLETLVRLADFYEVSIDSLLREGAEQPTAPIPPRAKKLTKFPADGVLRIVQVLDGHVLRDDEYDPDKPTPLCIPKGERVLQVSVHGNAAIQGDVNGSVKAGTHIGCGNVGDSVKAGTHISCGNVGGSVKAGTHVTCANVAGSVSAGSHIHCHDIGGSAKASKITVN